MLKKILALVLCFVLVFGVNVVVNADDVFSSDEYIATVSESNENQIQPRYSYTNTASCALNNSGGKAQCIGNVGGYNGTTTRIHLRIILQKKSVLWWSDVQEWYTISNTYHATLSKTVAVESGKYRVKLVAIVYANSGSEEIELYSKTYEF